jgi:DNA-binding response OmpR family regulator
MRILIIEDDADIGVNLYDYLQGSGHTVDLARDGAAGVRLATAENWDAILLDLTLPGIDGLEVCRRLRADFLLDTPVLMLTARDTLDDKLAGFSHGTDDYLVKPFALKEVEARLLALHKRYNGRMAGKPLQVGDLTFDPRTLAVTRGGHAVKLPPKCLQLLTLLMQHPGKVFRRADLEAAAWGDDPPDSDSLRTHMYALRRALMAHGGSDLIETVHGQGYRLVEPHA